MRGDTVRTSAVAADGTRGQVFGGIPPLSRQVRVRVPQGKRANPRWQRVLTCFQVTLSHSHTPRELRSENAPRSLTVSLGVFE